MPHCLQWQLNAPLFSAHVALAMIFTLTGSPLLLSALWNPEAVKQIEKWRVSTFRQRSNAEILSPRAS